MSTLPTSLPYAADDGIDIDDADRVGAPGMLWIQERDEGHFFRRRGIASFGEG